MSGSGRLVDYLAAGLASAKPATLTLVAGAIGIYYATDSDHSFIWDGSAWHDRGSGAVNALSSLSDVVLTSLLNGQVLAWDTATSKWKNVTISGGGGGSAPWYYSPQPASGFTTLLSGDATVPIVSDHSGAGLVADFGNSVGGDKTRGAWMSIPNPNVSWSIRAHYKWNVPKSSYLYGGFSLRDGAHGRFMTIGPIEDGGGDVTVRHFNTLGGTAANVCGFATRQVWEFVRIDYDVSAETLTYYASTDGAAWVLMGSNSRTVYYVNRLNQMGLALTMNNGGGVRCWMSCDSIIVL
jgi:hypothetical protein